MRKKVFVAILLVLLFSVSFLACENDKLDEGGSGDNGANVSKKVILEISDGVVSWNSIVGAEFYEYKIGDGEVNRVDGTSFKLDEFDSAGEREVFVRVANAEEDEWSKISFNVYCLKLVDGQTQKSLYLLEDSKFDLGQFTPTKEGHELIGYSDGEKEYRLGEKVAVSKNTEISPIFSVNTHKVAYFALNKNLEFYKFLTVEYDFGSTLPMVEIPEIDGISKDMYTFCGWYLDQNLSVESGYVTMPDKGLSLYPKIELNSFKLALNANGGTGGAEIMLKYGEPITRELLNSLAEGKILKSGYTVDGWFLESKCVTEFTGGKMSGELTLYAHYKVISHKVNYELEGGENHKDNPVAFSVETGAVTLKAASKKGYTFEGWYYGGERIVGAFNFIMQEDITISARFTLNEYKINYELEGFENTGGNPTTFSVLTGAVIFKPESKKGYRFDGWYYNGSKIIGSFELNMLSDITLTARFELIEYNITYELGGGKNSADNPVKYSIHTEQITFKSAVKNGYEFNGWYYNGSKVGDDFELNMESDIMLTARYSLITYDIVYNLNGGLNDDKNLETFSIETNVFTFKPATKLGYTFNGWYYNDRKIADSFALDMEHDIVLTAKYSVNVFNIKYELGGGENSNDNPNKFSIETGNVKFNAASKKGYTFVGWEYNGNIIENSLLLDMQHDITLIARYDLIKYKITYDLAGGNNNSENIAMFSIETGTFTFKPATKLGYTFDGWYYNDSKIADKFVLNMEHDIVLTAKYVVNVFNINYILGGGENSNDNPNKFSIETGNVKFNAASKKGYTFVGWEYNGNIIENSLLLDMQHDITLIARYDLIKYKITYDLAGGNNNSENIAMFSIETGTFTFKPATKLGYTFNGWYYNDNKIADSFALDMEHDIVLTAKYVVNVFNINYILGGGENSNDNPNKFSIESGNVKFNVASKKGYTFVGWEYNGNIIENSLMLDMQHDITLIAKYDLIVYNIRYDLAGGINDVRNITEFSTETISFTFNPAAKYGYSFVGWYYKDSKISDNFKLDMLEDIVLVARFNLIVYNINYELDGGVNSSENIKFYSVLNDSIILKNASKKGYTFAGWFYNGVKADENFSVKNLQGDITFFAQYNLIVYKITYSLDGGTNDGNNITEFSVLTEKANFKPASKFGYTFDGWYYNDNKISSDFVLDMERDIVLTARYNVNVFNIYYNLDGGENAYDNPKTFSIQTGNVTFKPAVKKGYKFIGWNYNGNIIEDNFALNMQCDLELLAVFTLNSYKINYDLDGGTNSAENILSFTVLDKEVSFKPASKNGYAFEGWYYNGKKIEEKLVLDMDKDITIMAKFTLIVYNITYELNGGQNHFENPTAYSVLNNKFSFKDAVKFGYNFVGWFYGDKKIDDGFIFNMNCNIVIKATFDLAVYNVNYVLNGGNNHRDNPNTFNINSGIITLQDAFRENSKFLGWYLTENFGGVEIIAINCNASDVTLYARFTCYYNLNIFLDGGELNVTLPTRFTEFDSISLAGITAKKDGYNFEGFYLDNGFNTACSEIPIGTKADVTLFAKFTKIHSDLSYALNTQKDGYIVSVSGDYLSSTDLIVPQFYKGLPIVGIAGKSNSALTSIVLPDTVAVIGEKVFSGCSNLISVNTTKGLTVIESFAFEGCERLGYFFIPQSVNIVGAFAFKNNLNMTVYVSYANETERPSGYAENFYLNNKAIVYKTLSITEPIDGAVYALMSGGAILISYVGSAQTFKVPDMINYVGGDLTFIVFSVGDGAFKDNKNLISFTASAYLMSIENEAFSGCCNLVNVDLRDVSTIGKRAFENCTSLASILIPLPVQSIGEFAFYGCEFIAIFCESTEKGYNWHENWNAFSNNLFCTVIFGMDKDKQIITVDGATYLKQLNYETYNLEVTLVKYNGNAEKFIIPECISDGNSSFCVEYIGIGAFEGNKTLKYVEIAATIKYIYEKAFYNVNATVFIPEVWEVGSMAFNGKVYHLKNGFMQFWALDWHCGDADDVIEVKSKDEIILY